LSLAGPAVAERLPAASPAEASIRQGASLMAASLCLVLLTNALARDLAARLPVGEILFCRFLGALPIVLLLAAKARIPLFTTQRLGIHVLRAALGIAAMGALYLSSQHLPFSDLIAISYSSPLLVALFAMPLLGERVSGRRFALISSGFLGVLLIAFPGHFAIWSLGALAMAMLNALAVIAARSLGRTEHPIAIACQFALFGAGLSLPLLALGCRLPSPSDLPELAALGVCAGLAIQLNAMAFRHAPASVLAPIDYAAVVISVAIGYVAWSETPTLSMILGGTLLIASGVLQLRVAQAEAVFHRKAAANPSGVYLVCEPRS
jgi:drug/metabolite transporter (DMT)-like permease